MFEQSSFFSPSHERFAKFNSLKQQVRERQIAHYKQTIRKSNAYLVINYEDSQGSILNLKRALLYCKDLEEQVINTLEQLMDSYDFSVQIAEQKLIETIIITFSTQQLKQRNQQKSFRLTLRWLHVMQRSIMGWSHLWAQLHQNIPSILWGLAIEWRSTSEVLVEIWKNLMGLDQNLKINIQPSLLQIQELLEQELNSPEILDLLEIGFSPARQCSNIYFPVVLSPAI